MSKRERSGGLVYSTEHGRMCPACQQPIEQCQCRQNLASRGDGKVRVGRETQGRKGKGVTVITGLPLDDAGINALAKLLKQRCGVGGTVREGVIEIQGEQRDLIVTLLQAQGYDAKKSGA